MFRKLRSNKFTDIASPAQEQFKGLGSWGNGGAMRVAPAALFAYQSYDKLLDTVRKVTQITHTNTDGINGAILQVIVHELSIVCSHREHFFNLYS